MSHAIATAHEGVRNVTRMLDVVFQKLDKEFDSLFGSGGSTKMLSFSTPSSETPDSSRPHILQAFTELKQTAHAAVTVKISGGEDQSAARDRFVSVWSSFECKGPSAIKTHLAVIRDLAANYHPREYAHPMTDKAILKVVDESYDTIRASAASLLR